jgi:NAD(P)-dependent dehydrogenase (short-subunit alcohol dehydrogenase family)
MAEVVVVIGAGSIGIAIARRISTGKHVLLADLREDPIMAAAKVMADAGFETSTATVDISARASVEALVGQATALGDVTGVIIAAGLSPSQAPAEKILAVDLYGSALVLELFGDVMAKGGSGIVVASQSGHRLPALSPEEDRLLATTPVEDLLALPMLQSDRITDPLLAYQYSKRCNALRVKAEAATRWAARGARVNAISPGIVMTPLARDELSGPRAGGYQRMIDGSPAARAGTPDEIAALAALMMGPDGAFINGSDFLIDGGVTASWFYGALQPE